MLTLTQITIGYREILKRTPDDVGIAYWLSRDDVNFDDFCRLLLQSNELVKNDLKWPYRQFFYLPNYNIVYNPIAKNANTSFKKILAHMSGFLYSDLLISDIHNFTDACCTGLQLSDYSIDIASDVISRIGGCDLFAFAIIRDPYERLASVYLEKFVYGRWRGDNSKVTAPIMQKVQNMSQVDLNSGISFKEFVECVLNESLNEADEHWKPQYLYLSDLSFSLYDFKNLDDLRAKLSHCFGRQFVEFKDNIVASSGKLFIPNAFMFKSCDFDKYPSVSIDSLYSPDLVENVYSCYSKDCSLYKSCL